MNTTTPLPRSVLLVAALMILAAGPLQAQRPELSDNVRPYVAVDAPVLALAHVRVIDGTGAPARADQTLVIREGRIANMGPSAVVEVPTEARVMDLTGKTVIPGLVMVHEHLFYPTGPGVYGNLTESFTRLYLAGGVTSMRTGGNMNGYGELAIARDIRDGRKPGPWIDASAPYLEGPGLPLGQVHALTGPADARRMVEFWSEAGATSFKAYMHITREELGAAIQAAHALGRKVTGHLCSVSYREAAELGIDDLEHGFLASTDFVKDKKPDQCPGQGAAQAALAQVDPEGPEFKALVDFLVERRVAVTSTLTVFETFTPGRPLPPGLDVLDRRSRTTSRPASRRRRSAPTLRTPGSCLWTWPSSGASRRPEACSSPAPTPRAAAGSSRATPISARWSCWRRRGSRLKRRSGFAP